jgi:photosystem II stability/assembly factor-like uncharacterized protein
VSGGRAPLGCGHVRVMVAAVAAVAAALAAAAVVVAACGILSGPASTGGNVLRRTSTTVRASTATGPSTSTTTSTTSLLPLLSSEQPGSLLQFVSPRTGWLATGTTILVTTDGGRTWRTSFSDTSSGPDDALVGQVQSIDFANYLDGWALIDGLGLMVTRNGGNTWSTPAEPPRGSIVMFTFVGPQEGWAITDQGVLLHTSDGGGSWLAESTPVPAVTVCATPARLWFGAGSGDVYTSDVGTPWGLSLSGAAVAPPFHNSVGPNPPPPKPWLACTGASAWALYQYGEAAGSDPFVVERTLDSGGDWAELGSPNGAPPIATPAGIGVTTPAATTAPGSPTSAWILGFCGACQAGNASLTLTGTASLATSSDRSMAFSTVTFPGPSAASFPPAAVSFLDAERGWAVIQEVGVAPAGPGATPTDQLLVTDDGGASWMLVNPDIEPQVSSA